MILKHKKILAVLFTIALLASGFVFSASAAKVNQTITLTLDKSNAGANFNFVVDEKYTVSAIADESGKVVATVPAFDNLVVRKGEAPAEAGNEADVEKEAEVLNQNISIQLGAENAGMEVFMEQDGTVNPDKLVLDGEGNITTSIEFSVNIGITSQKAVDEQTADANSDSVDTIGAAPADPAASDETTAAVEGESQTNAASENTEKPAKKDISQHIIFGVGLVICVGFLVYSKVSKNKKSTSTGKGSDDDDDDEI